MDNQNPDDRKRDAEIAAQIAEITALKLDGSARLPITDLANTITHAWRAANDRLGILFPADEPVEF